MEATANRKFTASVGGLEFDCEAGDRLDADAKTIEMLESAGLVTKQKEKGGKPGKAEKDD